MKLKDILKTGVVVGTLAIAGCSLPKQKFNNKKYLDNFYSKASHTADNLTFWNNKPTSYFNNSSYGPAIYGFGGIGNGQTDNVLNNLCPKIKTSECHYHKLGKWPSIMDKVKQQHKIGNPIIFIAHSAGCGEAVNVAKILEKTNVPIGMIFLDAAYLNSGLYKPSSKIPSNVYRVENYISNGPFKGRELKDSDFEHNNSAITRYSNYRLKTSHGGMTKKFTDQYLNSLYRLAGSRARY